MTEGEPRPTFLYARRGGGGIHASTSSEATTTVTDFISGENLALLSERGRLAIESLIRHDIEYGSQKHVYSNWPEPGTDDDGKRNLAEQVSSFLFVDILVMKKKKSLESLTKHNMILR